MKLREWLLMGLLEMGLKPYFCSDNKSIITENNSEHLVDSNAGENNCQFLNNLYDIEESLIIKLCINIIFARIRSSRLPYQNSWLE